MWKTNREMDLLKQSTKMRPVWHYLSAFGRTLYALRPGKTALRYFITGFLLCGISFGYGPVPMSLCLLTVCEKKYISSSVLGMITGYGLYWGLADSFPLYAILAIILCWRLIFTKSVQNQITLYIAVGATALLGLLFLIGERFVPVALIGWAINLACIATGTYVFQKAAAEKQFWAKLAICCCMLLGLNAIPLPAGLSLAAAFLAWEAIGLHGLYYTAAGCAALAAVFPATAHYAAVFCPVALISKLMPQSRRIYGELIFCGIYILMGIGIKNYSLALCCVLGTALGHFYPADSILPAPAQAKLPEHPAQQELRDASMALLQAAQMLQQPQSTNNREIADIFDSAAAQVCQSCAKYSTCWQNHAQELYEDLTACADAFLARGYAETQDFPQRFLSQCIHPEAFVTATNVAVDQVRARRRLRARIREAGKAAAKQYEIMGVFLQRLSNRLYAPPTAINYTPELAVQAAGRGGSSISGDRGAAFSGPGSTYYVLLCDGMGTGSGAAQESAQAIKMLRQLLLAGLDALSALHSLNGIYVLRDNGCFSTVDLLRVNLTSGDAILYKWGAAPSYLKRHRGLRFLGGVSLPPGLNQNGEIEQVRFSLDHGGVLILLSDGLGGKESLRRLESCESLIPKDVAASLFVGRAQPDDDCTAVAIRLRPFI
ncbi:MAG: hypothetical protein E7464_07730 [Ruminococcaceae bacterium]|nr:hypothetical protein [Oscillospiraceae bacterium]